MIQFIFLFKMSTIHLISNFCVFKEKYFIDLVIKI